LSTFHWLPIIGGYSAYPPRTGPYVHSLAQGLPGESALGAVLDTVDIGWILVHLDELSAEGSRRWQQPLPEGLKHAGQWGNDLLLRVTRRGREDLQARLLSTEKTLGGVPIAPLPERCPGELRLTVPPPDPWKPGSEARLKVEVHNTGSSPWPARGFVPRHLVSLRACFGEHVQPRCRAHPMPLPDDVPAGGRIIVPIAMTAPGWLGNYALRISLYQVGRGPLERCGVEPLVLPVRVW